MLAASPPERAVRVKGIGKYASVMGTVPFAVVGSWPLHGYAVYLACGGTGALPFAGAHDRVGLGD
jgi:hypothetical protein